VQAHAVEAEHAAPPRAGMASRAADSAHGRGVPCQTAMRHGFEGVPTRLAAPPGWTAPGCRAPMTVQPATPLPNDAADRILHQLGQLELTRSIQGAQPFGQLETSRRISPAAAAPWTAAAFTAAQPPFQHGATSQAQHPGGFAPHTIGFAAHSIPLPAPVFALAPTQLSASGNDAGGEEVEEDLQGVPLHRWSAQQVAARVRSLGTAWEFAAYADAMKAHGVSGAVLCGYDRVSDLLDDLEITHRLHRIALQQAFDNLLEDGKAAWAACHTAAKGSVRLSEKAASGDFSSYYNTYTTNVRMGKPSKLRYHTSI